MSDLNASLAECNTKMNKAIDVAKEDFATIRTGRAHPAMFAKLMVDYYGTGTPLSSDLGVNPGSDGTVIRVNFPQLTEERRKEFIKVAKGKAEDSKVSIRAIRRAAKEAMEKLEKDGKVGKDDLARAEKELEKVTGEHTAKIDELLKHKEAELLEV